MDENKKLCTILYAVFALASLIQFSSETMTIGTIALLIASFVASRKRKKTTGSIYESHFHWLDRTFWIGGGIYFPILTLLGIPFLWSNSDLDQVMSAVENGASTEELQSIFMASNGSTLINTSLVMYTPFLVWWLRRCWRGYKHLKNDEPVPNVMSWL